MRQIYVRLMSTLGEEIRGHARAAHRAAERLETTSRDITRQRDLMLWDSQAGAKAKGKIGEFATGMNRSKATMQELADALTKLAFEVEMEEATAPGADGTARNLTNQARRNVIEGWR